MIWLTKQELVNQKQSQESKTKLKWLFHFLNDKNGEPKIDLLK
jgi:hypothetical protein